MHHYCKLLFILLFPLVTGCHGRHIELIETAAVTLALAGAFKFDIHQKRIMRTAVSAPPCACGAVFPVCRNYLLHKYYLPICRPSPTIFLISSRIDICFAVSGQTGNLAYPTFVFARSQPIPLKVCAVRPVISKNSSCPKARVVKSRIRPSGKTYSAPNGTCVQVNLLIIAIKLLSELFFDCLPAATCQHPRFHKENTSLFCSYLILLQ